MHILTQYAIKHNATIYFNRTEKIVGSVTGNWTGTGMMKAFLEDKADVVSSKLKQRKKHLHA